MRPNIIGGTSLVVAEVDLFAGALLVVADGFEGMEVAHDDGVYGVFGGVEADMDVGLCAEVVDVVMFDDVTEGGAVVEIAVVEEELGIFWYDQC